MGSKSEEEDLQLLDLWNAGDRAAGNRLVSKHHACVTGFFRNSVNDDDRPDLAQETFRRLVAAKDRFRREAGVRTYIFAIARRVLLDHLRKQYRDSDKFDPLTHTVEDIDGATPSMLVAELQRNRKVLACLRALPVDTKQLLELYYWQGCTAEELGKVFASPEDGTEIPAGTIRRRIHDAKAKLRKCLAEDGTQPASPDRADEALEDELRALGVLLVSGPSGV